MARKTPIELKGAKLIQVIETRLSTGVGTEADPCREVIQYWDFDGMLLAESDPVKCGAILAQDLDYLGLLDDL